MVNMQAAVEYAKNYWWRPCADNLVYTKHGPVNVADEARKRQLEPSIWPGRFLLYDAPKGGVVEGLYLVHASQAPLEWIKGVRFHARNFPGRQFLCSWADAAKHEDEGLTPPLTGLNDCAHFVSECLKRAGLGGVYSAQAARLVSNLRARADVKTLCFGVHKDVARRIINGGVMTPGDVIAFNDSQGVRHATIYLGGRTNAMHTYSNHPDGNFRVENAEGGPNTWEVSCNEGHPLVTLLHFSHADVSSAAAPWMPGEWQMNLGGQVVYYHFDHDGKCSASWRPEGQSAGPDSVKTKGYWFATPEGGVRVVWRENGAFESYGRPVGLGISGTCNGQPIMGVRSGP